MKKVYNLVLVLIISLMTINLSAQERFLDEVFSEVTVTQNAGIYATNATVILAPTIIKKPLVFDFYEPTGDTLSTRPLVIYFPTGNFLPIKVNGGVSGSMRDSAVVEISSRLAKLGYVVAVCDYRKGWNPISPDQTVRTETLINAAYRGLQDARSAIRFFRKNVAENSNSYKVDTSRITLFGQGTGGYITLAAATLDDYQEILTTTNGPGKFLKDTDSGTVPMVIPFIHGDIEGKTNAGVRATASDPYTDTLSYANHPNYSSEFHLQVNLGGALGDISWLDPGDVPMITFQAPKDAFAPYDDAVLKVPTTGGDVVQVQGGKAIMDSVNVFGNNQIFIDAAFDDPYTQAAKAATAAIEVDSLKHPYFEGLYPINLPLNSFMRNEGSPWEWWEPMAWDTVMHPTCQALMLPFPQCNYHTIALQTNELMSPQRARTYIDTIIGYMAPRAYEVLNLGDLTSSTEEILQDQEVKLTIAPNPSRDVIRIRTELDEMKDVIIYDINGRTVRGYQNLNSFQLDFNRSDLPPGMYIAKLRFDKGVITKKLMFR